MCVCIHFINTILFALSLSQLGGTIGDIEGMPFVEAFRQFQFRCGLTNFANVHVSLVPQVIGVTFYVRIFNQGTNTAECVGVSVGITITDN